MNERQPFQQLLQSYLQNKATSEEYQQLMQYIKQGEHDEQLKAIILEAMQNDEVTARLDTIRANDLLNRILSANDETAKLIPMAQKKQLWKRIAIAASILITIGIAAYFVISTKEKSLPTHDSPLTTHDVLAPDKNRAQIKLADGTIVYLDSAANGELVNVNGVQVLKTEDGKIVYSPLTTHDSPLKTSYNTLTNPRGSIVMNMTLSDGSKVWLNAGSSITYPVAFTGNERKISMTGEAYFEIAHDKSKPFIVSANNKADVTVLGTHFNVNSYEDEDAIKVTLLEGSVQVSAPSVNTSVPSVVKIKPGQQAILSLSKETQNLELRTQNSVDLDEIMSWKNGTFSFDNADIKTILRQFARWYDVEVIYEGKTSNRTFFGVVKRSSSLTEVLKMLKANEIKFRIDGKKLFVTGG